MYISKWKKIQAVRVRRVGYNERDGCARMLREMATSMVQEQER